MSDLNFPQQRPHYAGGYDSVRSRNGDYQSNQRPGSSSSAAGPDPNANKKVELDPTFLEGCASLLDQIDKRVIVLLRDQKTLIGTLRSIDQFNNLVLQDTVERISVGKVYGDIPRGLYIVRGDTVVLVGEMDLELEKRNEMKELPVEVVLAAQREQTEAKKIIESKREQAFKDRGMAFVKDSGLDEF